MIWRDAVIAAIHRFSNQHQTRKFTRQQLIEEQLGYIITVTESQGATPSQTLSRVLQELRRDKYLYFEGDGVYVLLDTSIDIETEELSPKTLDFAIKHKKLQLGVVAIDDPVLLTRRRKGQARIRELALQDYNKQCALCDIAEIPFLVASHISRWADNLQGRGDLSNVICLCKFHDALFEEGYFSLTDDYKILKRSTVNSQMIKQILDLMVEFRLPQYNNPSPNYLQEHRKRCGF